MEDFVIFQCILTYSSIFLQKIMQNPHCLYIICKISGKHIFINNIIRKKYPEKCKYMSEVRHNTP